MATQIKQPSRYDRFGQDGRLVECGVVIFTASNDTTLELTSELNRIRNANFLIAGSSADPKLAQIVIAEAIVTVDGGYIGRPSAGTYTLELKNPNVVIQSASSSAGLGAGTTAYSVSGLTAFYRLEGE